ncbi:MAG: hypothetical protein HOP16_11695 [Acidobacteria bacterium]|nr:hypothetical protein [Acidobacteriota bacterium]
MPHDGGRFLKDNAFMVAAIALPVVVSGLFILASAIPRWTVAPPTHDLIFKAQRPYTQPPAAVIADFNVRDGRVEVTVRPSPPNSYMQPWSLLRYDHDTMTVEEIPLDLPPAMAEGATSETRVIESLATTRLSAQSVAPDGYELRTRTNGSPGIVGGLFGMGGYRQTASLENNGRIIALNLPAPFGDPYQSPVLAVGWVLDEGTR